MLLTLVRTEAENLIGKFGLQEPDKERAVKTGLSAKLFDHVQ